MPAAEHHDAAAKRRTLSSPCLKIMPRRLRLIVKSLDRSDVPLNKAVQVMPGIDDPIDAVKKQYPEEADRSLELILDIASKLDLFAGVVNTIRKHFSRDAFKDRVNALLLEFEAAIRRLEKDAQSLSGRLESPQLVEALTAAVNEAVRTSDVNKIKRFASILGHSVTERSDRQLQALEEASAYIRDVAQLGEADIEAIRILYSVQAPIFSSGTVTTDPNPYTERIKDVLKAVDQAAIPREEFYARCSRLNGFGLAIEVQRNDGRMAPGDHCFRLTSRGAKLISMIAQIDSPV